MEAFRRREAAQFVVVIVIMIVTASATFEGWRWTVWIASGLTIATAIALIGKALHRRSVIETYRTTFNWFLWLWLVGLIAGYAIVLSGIAASVGWLSGLIWDSLQ